MIALHTSSRESTSLNLRHLHAGHFAFMRAVLQGLDSRKSWDRYMRVEGAHGDARQVRRTINWIRDVFAAAAKRHGRPGTARLVVMELAQIDRTTRTFPSLADFIHTENLENFSEVDQIEQYQQRYDVGAKKHLRHARLLARQLEALNWLQHAIAQAPQPEEPVANWIYPGLASHLAKAGLHRLTDLVTHMDCFGAHWWHRIDAIGPAKAARIAQWVAAHPSLWVTTSIAPGTPIQSSPKRPGKNPRRPPMDDAQLYFLPLDQMTLPPEIVQHAPFRGERAACRIVAPDDLTAIRAWLGAKGSPPLESDTLLNWSTLGPLSHTQRAYWKEAERFMLWLALAPRIGLSAVTTQECALYRDFLAAPPPAWCAPRGRGKWHPQWRPFEGPLSASAQRYALTVVRGLYRYLVNQRYLTSSPWEAVQVSPANIAMSDKGRFNACAWNTIDRGLADLPPTSVNQRLALAIELISATGLRVGQLVQARVSDLCLASNRTSWCLRLDEPGRTVRNLALPLRLGDRLCAYLRERGLDANLTPAASCNAHLLGIATDAATRAPWAPCARRPLDFSAGIGAGTLRDQIKHFFQQCRTQVLDTDPLLAAQFAAASSEWLRAGRSGN